MLQNRDANSSLMVFNNKLLEDNGIGIFNEDEGMLKKLNYSKIMVKFKQMKMKEDSLTSELKKQRKITEN